MYQIVLKSHFKNSIPHFFEEKFQKCEHVGYLML